MRIANAPRRRSKPSLNIKHQLVFFILRATRMNGAENMSAISNDVSNRQFFSVSNDNLDRQQVSDVEFFDNPNRNVLCGVQRIQPSPKRGLKAWPKPLRWNTHSKAQPHI